MKRLPSIGIVLFISLFVLIFALWLVLTSSLFRDLRVSLVSKRLSEELNRTVLIDGDVALKFDGGPAMVATDLRLPAESFPDTDLARLDHVGFTIVFGFGRGDGVYLPRIAAHGLDLNLILRDDGDSTFASTIDARQVRSDRPSAGEADLIAFLGERDISFERMQLRYENQLTGFEYNFALDALQIDQLINSNGENMARVLSEGRVNDDTFSFSGDFPDDAPFHAIGTVGDLSFRLDGQKPEGAPRGDFIGELKLDTPNVQNLLDVLKLDGRITAEADANLTISRHGGQVDLDQIDLHALLKDGEVLTLTGWFEDPRFGQNFDLLIEVDAIGNAPPPPPAIFFRDVRVETAEMRILAEQGEIEIDRFEFSTNAFDEEVRDIGPFRVAYVKRTPDGKLQLEGVTLAIGPPDNPFLLAQGRLDNLLTFEGYELSGRLDLPAERVLLTLRPEEAARFGRLTGQMYLQETDGEPDLQRFELKSEDTDLWSAAIELSSADLDDFDQVRLDVDIETPDGKRLLDALRLGPVDVGRLGYDLTLTRAQTELTTQAVLSAGQSAISSQMALSFAESKPRLRGKLQSGDLRIKDARDAALALNELAQLKSVYVESRTLNDPEIEIQPLVLPGSDGLQIVADLSDYQPLVLPQNALDLTIEEVLNPDNMLRLIDAEVDIDFDRITGQQGLSRLNSTLQMKNGDVRFGPVDVSYGGGSARFTALLDVVDAPQWLRVAGQTGGWDIGELFQEFGVDLGASGRLTGTFDLSGRHSPPAAFAASMHGTASVDLNDGRIDSSLLDLAGIGVLPWLFSKERRQGYTTIVCIKAPLTVASGRVETDQSVIETERVQLVASGVIDIPGKRIALRADPRPVGRPLSRSAWPIEITGSLDAPDVSVATRTKRRATVPLAMPDVRTPCIPDVTQLRQTGR